VAAALTDSILNPARPSHVPPHADWYFDSQEWLAAERDADGELHGLLCTYRADGTPWLEYQYRHGKRHGRFRRFYASGTVAQEGRYLEELLDGLLVVSSEGSNTHSIRECCIPNAARVMKQEHRRGQLLAESFYDAEGRQLFEPHLTPVGGTSVWPEPLREREVEVFEAAFDFWPGKEPLAALEAAEPVTVEQSLAALREAIGRAALRVSAVRSALLAQGEAPLPPDISALIGDAAPALRTFAFAVDDEASTTVHVDETLHVDGLSVRELRAQARLEWTSLCWLCWAAGLDQVAVPSVLVARSGLYAALMMASTRQAALNVHRLELDDAPHFHGVNEKLLPASALQHLADQYREIRAALLFATDPECQSPWQDDLGRDELAEPLES
jgi:hypothetical protein